MTRYNAVGEISVPEYHQESMWTICKNAIAALNPRIREKRKTFLFVGTSDDDSKTVTLTLVDKGGWFEAWYQTPRFISDDDPARKAGEKCRAYGINTMKLYAM